MKITRGAAPAAGFEAEAPAAASSPAHPVAQARANRRKAEESMPDMPAAGLCSLQWEEAMTVAALRIRRVVSYDAIAIWACDDDFVEAKFAGGEQRAGLESLKVRQGEGLVGWVAEVGKPILNGNPAVEPGYAKREGAAGLASALALPLVNTGRVVGVVALYRRERDAFAADELVVLLELCPALASLILDISEPSNNLLEMSDAIQRDGTSLMRA
jgi:signal transduction protein with GAF and PtsI domain